MFERGTFQPELTGAHFMRLAKTPANFALRDMAAPGGDNGLLGRLARELVPWSGARAPEPAVKPIVEALYGWWRGLPQSAMSTDRLSTRAQAVRLAIAKAREPADLVCSDLPKACGLEPDAEGGFDAGTFVERLNATLQEIADSGPTTRRLAEAALLDAFGVGSPDALRDQLKADYGAHLLKLTDRRMRAFVDRAAGREHEVDRWLDGIAGLLCGRRIDSWEDGHADQFAFEVTSVAQRLTRWLAAIRAETAASVPVISVHVVGTDGGEHTLVVRPGSPGGAARRQMDRIRAVLGDGPEVGEALAHLVAERLGAKETVDG